MTMNCDKVWRSPALLLSAKADTDAAASLLKIVSLRRGSCM